MAKNRKGATEWCLQQIEEMMPGSENTKIIGDWLNGLTDEEFRELMSKFRRNEARVPLIAPNLNKSKLDVRRNLALAEKLGYNFFQRIQMPAENGTPSYLTPIPYLVVELPVRRQAQLQIKKISIPENNRSIDDLTGQPTGASKGSKLSFPEIQILSAKALDEPLLEMIKFRGGDLAGFNAMNKSISRTGGVSLKAISGEAGGVKSTQTLRTLLYAMHLSNTLTDK